MRLEPEEIVAIKAAALRVFGDGVKVCLYGSRADDSKRGGDIDLLIETPQATDDKYADENKFRQDLEDMIGERRVDVLVRAANDPLTTIQDIALSTGVRIL